MSPGSHAPGEHATCQLPARVLSFLLPPGMPRGSSQFASYQLIFALGLRRTIVTDSGPLTPDRG